MSIPLLSSMEQKAPNLFLIIYLPFSGKEAPIILFRGVSEETQINWIKYSLPFDDLAKVTDRDPQDKFLYNAINNYSPSGEDEKAIVKSVKVMKLPKFAISKGQKVLNKSIGHYLFGNKTHSTNMECLLLLELSESVLQVEEEQQFIDYLEWRQTQSLYLF
jgi:hypothetical protein